MSGTSEIHPRSVLCPIVTPFTETETGAGTGNDVDHTGLRSVIEFVSDAGIDGIVPCGTTGEFASLTPIEYRAVIETAVDVADETTPVIAGVAATDIPSVRSNLEFAAQTGADAALLAPPYFHTGPGSTGIEQFFYSAVAESPLPVVLYNIPACTGQPISPETVATLAETDTVIGLKDSSGDFDYVLEVLSRTDSSFHVFEGYDRHYVSGVHAGTAGGINALSNVLPERFCTIREKAFNGETQTAFEIEQSALAPLFDLCLEYGFAPVTKVGLTHRGVIDSASVRAPLVELPEEVHSQVTTLVADAIVDS